MNGALPTDNMGAVLEPKSLSARAQGMRLTYASLAPQGCPGRLDKFQGVCADREPTSG